MVSMSSAAPDASRIWRVALMISGPMPSPWATVMGVLVAMEYNRIAYGGPHQSRDHERAYSPVLLPQLVADRDRSQRLHGLPIQLRRLIQPLADCLQRGLCQPG